MNGMGVNLSNGANTGQAPHSIIVFTLDGQRYALPLHAADRVVRIVAIGSLPKAPGIVFGVINIQGKVIPVINMRRRFALPEREIVLSDQLVVAHTAKRSVALIADEVLDVMSYPEQDMVAADQIVPGIEYVKGVVKLKDGLVFIHDLDKFLSLDEEDLLDRSLETT